MMRIYRDNPKPLYRQIAEILKDKIIGEEFQPGDNIGTQTELKDQFHVSTITIRQAVKLLEKEKLVVTKQGKGTFVKPRKVEQELLRLQSLSAVIEESGYMPTVEIRTFTLVDTPADIKIFGPECFYIERIHKIDEEPIALSHIYLPYAIGNELTSKDLENQTIYQLLESKFGTEVGEAVQRIESCPAIKDLAEFLEVPEGTPLLKAARIAYDKSNTPVEKITFYYRHNEFKFKIKLTAANQDSLWPMGN